MKSYIVLLSGGLDSTCMLAHVAKKKGLENVSAVTVVYPSKHNAREIKAAQAVCAAYGIEQELFVAPDVFGLNSQLMRSGPEIEDGQYPLSGVAGTNVPLRNPVFITCIAAIAASRFSYSEIFVAVHANDYSSWSYPDCSPEAMGALAAALYLASNFSVRLETPFIYMPKDEVLKLGVKESAPLHLTYSCYKGGEKHCGVCPTCLERKKAFTWTFNEDPTEYGV